MQRQRSDNKRFIGVSLPDVQCPAAFAGVKGGLSGGERWPFTFLLTAFCMHIDRLFYVRMAYVGMLSCVVRTGNGYKPHHEARLAVLRFFLFRWFLRIFLE